MYFIYRSLLKFVNTNNKTHSSQYENESYDYPPNLKESFTEFSKTISEKVQGLSNVTSAAEAGQVLSAPYSHKEHKTFNHALSRAAAAGAAAINDKTDPLAVALDKYSVAESKVGDGRLAQDTLISTRVNSALSTTLNTSLKLAARARSNVQQARLNLDAAKAAAKSAKPERQATARVEVEQAEDEFVAATEEAVSVMKNILDAPEPIRNLSELVTAQLAYHKASVEILSKVLPEIEELHADQQTKHSDLHESVAAWPSMYLYTSD